MQFGVPNTFFNAHDFQTLRPEIILLDANFPPCLQPRRQDAANLLQLHELKWNLE
jgi:hypothetical protein